MVTEHTECSNSLEYFRRLTQVFASVNGRKYVYVYNRVSEVNIFLVCTSRLMKKYKPYNKSFASLATSGLRYL